MLAPLASVLSSQMLPVLKWMVVLNKCATNPVAEAG